MGEYLRLAVLALALFGAAYGAVIWASKGWPLRPGVTTPPPALQPTAPAPVDTWVPLREAEAPRGDGHPQRDKLRLAAMQASAAYARAPCDRAVKAQMIEAVSAYAKAWRDMMGCGPQGCDHRQLNAAAAAFSTPLDGRLREAVADAFDKRGITVDDFPSPLRINVTMLARGRGDPVIACPEIRADAWR